MTSLISKKICMLGDFSVGKTSLIRRFVERQFSDKYLSTVGVKISRKTVEVQAKTQKKALQVQMLIWDLEGNTKFKTVTPMYLQGATSAVIVADVSRQVTIDHISDHLQAFLSVNPKGFGIVALNKADLLSEKQQQDLLEKCQLNYPNKITAVYPTSAKTGKNVDDIFFTLAQQMVE